MKSSWGASARMISRISLSGNLDDVIQIVYLYILQYNKEREGLQVSSDSSDFVDSSDEDKETGMERFIYQRNRIKQEILRQLVIVESTKEFHDAISNENALKKAKKKTLPRNFKSEKTSPPPRRPSLRLLRKDPHGIDLPPKPETSIIEEHVHPRKPGREFQMSAVGFVKAEHRLDEMTKRQSKKMEKSFNDYENFMKSLSNIRDVPDFIGLRPFSSSLNRLESLKIRPEHVRKVTKTHISSLAIHPSLTEVLIAAGDREGNLGLWRPMQHDSNDSAYMFKPHVKPISCMKFSLFDLKLYMCSYDGQFRTMDLARNVFDEAIIDDDRMEMSGFDFLESTNTLIASRHDGCLSIVDTRVASKKNIVQTFKAHHRATKCVSCHPLQKYYVSTSHRDGSVFIFDVRKIVKGKNHCMPVVELKRHIRSTSSAYFSPVTGKHILTTSKDNHLRVFDTSVITMDQVKLKSSYNHNNQIGKGLSSFKAVWQPNRDDVFVVGSMDRPGQIDMYNDAARHILPNPEVPPDVCSITCFHETRNMLAGGASGGKVFMFCDEV